MTFAQWMTLLAILTGPLGIVAGWGLSFFGESRREERAAEKERSADEVRRVVSAVRSSKFSAGELRALGHASSLNLKTGQVEATMVEFNHEWRSLETLTAEADVLGPLWLSEVLRPVQEKGQAVIRQVMEIQQRRTPGDSSRAADLVEELDAAVAELVAECRSRLRPNV